MNLSLCNTDIIRSRDNQIQISVAGNKYQNIITGPQYKTSTPPNPPSLSLPQVTTPHHWLVAAASRLLSPRHTTRLSRGLSQAAPRLAQLVGEAAVKPPEELRCRSAPLRMHELLHGSGVCDRSDNFSRKKILKKEGRHSDYSKLVIFSLQSSSQIHRRRGWAGAAGGPPWPGGGGPAGRLSSREKLPSWAVLV